MSDIMLVAAREFKTNMLKKSSIIAMIVVAALIAVGMFVVNYFATKDDAAPAYTVGVASEVQQVGDILKSAGEQSGQTVELKTLERAEAEQQIRDGDIDGYLTGSPDDIEFLVGDSPRLALNSMVQGIAGQQTLATEIANLGGNPAQVMQKVAQSTPTITSIDGTDSESKGKAFFVAMIGLSLVMFALISGGAILSMGVVEEKTSRVVELLLATIRPSQLLAGKVIGIGATILLQFLTYIGVFAAVGYVTGIMDILPSSPILFVLQLLMWTMFGFVLYSVIWAALASTVSRQEDVGAITTPMTFIILGGFYLGMFLVPNSPDSSATFALSLVPFFSPFMMPVRMALGAVPMWQILLALALLIAAIFVVLWLGGKIYQRAVLHTGSRMSLKEALTGRNTVRRNA